MTPSARSTHRILAICGDHGVPAFGRKGASTHLREMISALRRAGAEVMLAASNLEGDPTEEERSLGTVELPRPRSKLLGSDGRYVVADWLANERLREAAARFRPTAFYERSALYFRAGERIARALGKPRLLEVNTLLARELGHRLHFPKWAAAREKGLITHASGICAISPVMKRELENDFGIPPERVGVFTMAVNAEKFRPRGRRAIVRDRLGLSRDDLLIAYLGSMNHYHQPETFFKMAKRLAGESPGVAFVMVGGADSKVADYREKAKSLPEGSRYFVEGSVPQSELPDWIEAFDLVVIPGAAPQSTPTKIFEIAAMARPLLAPATEPIRGIVGEAAPELAFPEDDFEELCARARAWIAAPNSLAEASQRLKSHILSHYTWDHHASRVLEWFDELAGRPKN